MFLASYNAINLSTYIAPCAASAKAIAVEVTDEVAVAAPPATTPVVVAVPPAAAAPPMLKPTSAAAAIAAGVAGLFKLLVNNPK